MTTTKTITKSTRKLVVVFDICSSTTILNDLLFSEQQTKWRNLIIGMKRFLTNHSEKLGFEIYKFVGDGWILMFPDDFDGFLLHDFLYNLCERYIILHQRVEPFLSTGIETIGLTIGIDKGTVIHLVMNGKREYIGKPINVAARLQGAIKDGDPNPENKVLISRSVYNDFPRKQQQDIAKRFTVTNGVRNLRNVLGNNKYLCKKVTIL